MAELTWERIADPLDSRKTVWWRGTWPGCGPAYLSVASRGGVYVWAARRRPGPDHIAAEGHAATLATARNRADRARADMSASVVDMTMTPHERAKAANAALTKEQRSAAGKARAAALHSITSYAQRVADRWETATDDERREVRRRLRAAGVFK